MELNTNTAMKFQYRAKKIAEYPCILPLTQLQVAGMLQNQADGEETSGEVQQ